MSSQFMICFVSPSVSPFWNAGAFSFGSSHIAGMPLEVPMFCGLSTMPLS